MGMIHSKLERLSLVEIYRRSSAGRGANNLINTPEFERLSPARVYLEKMYNSGERVKITLTDTLASRNLPPDIKENLCRMLISIDDRTKLINAKVATSK